MIDRLASGEPRLVEIIPGPNGGLLVIPPRDITPFLPNLLIIRRCIETGRPIPARFYRRSDGIDGLYRETGWHHLHVGIGINDDVLLLVKEVPGRVIFVAFTDHSIFRERPKARRIRKRAGSRIAAVEMIARKRTP